LRVQIPAKAKFAPTCVRNSLLSELKMYYLFIMRQVICLFVYIGKNPRFTAFLDSNLNTRLAIVTENELGLAFPPRNLPKKFRSDPSTFYLVIVVTNKQTDRQTHAGKNIIPRFRGDNKCTAVRKVATPLRELTCHMGSHSVTCHPAEVTFPPLPQPKLVLD